MTTNLQDEARETALRPRRWDPLVKLTHWSIVAAIVANALFTGEGSYSHMLVGYGLAAILALRLLWGLVGPAEARFSAFPPSPRRAIAHIREIAKGDRKPHRSHNPLGALMVYAIWATLLGIIASGAIMTGPNLSSPVAMTEATPSTQARVYDEEAEDEDEAGEEREEGALGEVHEAAVTLLYGLILLHIGGVLFESRRQGRSLALAMLPGRS